MMWTPIKSVHILMFRNGSTFKEERRKMGKGIKNRGSQVHKIKTKYNRKGNMENRITIEEEDYFEDKVKEFKGTVPAGKDIIENYTFSQVRISYDDNVTDRYSVHLYPPKYDKVKMEFEVETLPELLDMFRDFLVKSGYTYVGSLTAHSKLDDKTWKTSEESK